MKAREKSFGQNYHPSLIDRFGVWLSAIKILKYARDFEQKRIGDFGCGYQAQFARTVLNQAQSTLLIDVALADDLKQHPKVQAIEGSLPMVLPTIQSGSLDIIMLISVLEHLWDPLDVLSECRRIIDERGVCIFNVPSWKGKKYLEMSAFRLGLSPKEEMDDHKRYYDPKDLWPILVKAGFLPSKIKCFTHKFGLNTFAVCEK